MLQKFKILPMRYFASDKITETVAKIVKFPLRLRNLTEIKFLLYFFLQNGRRNRNISVGNTEFDGNFIFAVLFFAKFL